jgi:hypothetical protein
MTLQCDNESYEECSETLLQDSLGPVPEFSSNGKVDGFFINSENLISTSKVFFYVIEARPAACDPVLVPHQRPEFTLS